MKRKSKSRKSIRFKDFDYSQPAGYFVTICVDDMKCVFGEINNESMELNKLGLIAKKFWLVIPEHFNNVILDEFIIMPNHVHGIIYITATIPAGVQYIEPLQKTHKFQKTTPNSLSTIIRSCKAALTRWCTKNNYPDFKWQRNFFERVIRNEKEFDRIREYIYYNPVKWNFDRNNIFAENYESI